MSDRPRRGRQGSSHPNNAILSISIENAGIRVLHDDPNLAASVKQTLTHLPRVIFIEPLFTLEDHDSEGLNGCRPVELLIDPARDMRNG